MLKDLPNWDLSDLYKGMQDPCIEEDKKKIEKKTLDFLNNYKNNLSLLSSEQFVEAIKEYENINILINKLMSYGYLLYVTNILDEEISSFMQDIKEFLYKVSLNIAFFELELNNLSDLYINKLVEESSEIYKYKSYLENNKRFKPYQLTELAEKIFVAKSSVSYSAWVRLYDETLANMIFVDHTNLNNNISLSSILNLMLNQDSEVRTKAAESLKKGLLDKQSLIVTILNNIIKDHSISNEFRGFKKPYSVINLHNMISDNVMEGLVKSVSDSYKDISHKYYEIKRKILNLKELRYWDRNAPLYKVNTKIDFEQAKQIVLEAYYNFDYEFGSIAELFFDKKWIDAKPSDNKDSGAFCHPSVSSNHPYILLNFHGEYSDVMTLAHELGHGIHQYLSKRVGELQADSTLILAETASIFGEQLVFDKLKNETQDLNMKRFLISNKIESIINSVQRQIAFHKFEEKLHFFRKNKELSINQIKQFFVETQKECLGESVKLDEDDGLFCLYVSHFFHSPFYVYAYAFGDCFVRSLYSLYKCNNNKFKENYKSFLSSGSTLTPETVLKKFDLNIESKKFWGNGLRLTQSLINEFEDIK